MSKTVNHIVDLHSGDDSEGPNDGALLENYLKRELYALLQQDSLVFEFLQEGALDGIWYWDIEKVENEWMSPKFWEVLGYDSSTKKHLASEWQDIIFPEDLAVATQNFHQHLKDPSYPYDQLVRYRHSNGSVVWIRCRGIAIHDPAGKPIRFLGAHIDLTPVMEARQELVRERLRQEEVQQRVVLLEAELNETQSRFLSIQNQLEEEKKQDEATGLLKPRAMQSRLCWLAEIARQSEQELSIIQCQIANREEIEATWGCSELQSKLARLAGLWLEVAPDALIGEWSFDVVTVAVVGRSSSKTRELCDRFDSLIEKNNWSIVAPQVDLHCYTGEMLTGNLEFQLKEIQTTVFSMFL